jgi:RNA polymerase sigma-70 factor (ECF subfamily)
MQQNPILSGVLKNMAQLSYFPAAAGNEMGRAVVVSVMNAHAEGVSVADGVVDIATGGTDEAFRRVSARHVESAYRLAWAILGNDSDAEDATQDAFTSAWRQRLSLRDPDRFEAWFGRILVNSCRDRLRRRSRTWNLFGGEPDGVSPDHAPTALERDELYAAITALHPDQRIVVMLRFWQDLTVDEIADRLDVPAGTVKSRLHRSMARLRAVLEEDR